MSANMPISNSVVGTVKVDGKDYAVKKVKIDGKESTVVVYNVPLGSCVSVGASKINKAICQEKYGWGSFTVDEGKIQELNHIKDYKKVKAGQTVYLPLKCGSVFETTKDTEAVKTTTTPETMANGNPPKKRDSLPALASNDSKTPESGEKVSTPPANQVEPYGENLPFESSLAGKTQSARTPFKVDFTTTVDMKANTNGPVSANTAPTKTPENCTPDCEAQGLALAVDKKPEIKYHVVDPDATNTELIRTRPRPNFDDKFREWTGKAASADQDGETFKPFQIAKLSFFGSNEKNEERYKKGLYDLSTQYIARGDTDNDGYLNKTEFIALDREDNQLIHQSDINKRAQKGNESAYDIRFANLDTNHDGLISWRERANFLALCDIGKGTVEKDLDKEAVRKHKSVDSDPDDKQQYATQHSAVTGLVKTEGFKEAWNGISAFGKKSDPSSPDKILKIVGKDVVERTDDNGKLIATGEE